MGHIVPVALYQPSVAVIAVRRDATSAATDLHAPHAAASPEQPVLERSAPTAVAGTHRPIDADLLHHMIAAAVDEVLDHPDTMSDGTTAIDPVAPSERFADAVVAAHEQRIAMLRERIAALGTAGAAPALLGDLHDRLRRAEAARRLALARIGGAPSSAGNVVAAPAVARPKRPEPVIARPAHPWRMAGAVIARQQSAPVMSLRLAAGQPQIMMPPRFFARVSVSAVGVHRHDVTAAAPRFRLRSIAVAYVPHRHERWRRSRDHMFAVKLATARRSLAMARNLLVSSPVRDTAGTGLWQWQGGATWRLPLPSAS